MATMKGEIPAQAIMRPLQCDDGEYHLDPLVVENDSVVLRRPILGHAELHACLKDQRDVQS